MTGTARWSDGTEMVTLDYSYLTSVLWEVCKDWTRWKMRDPAAFLDGLRVNLQVLADLRGQVRPLHAGGHRCANQESGRGAAEGPSCKHHRGGREEGLASPLETLPVLSAITRQPGFLWFVVKDSCVESSPHRPAPERPWRSGCLAAAAPARCRRPRCCWRSAACSSPPSSSSGRDRPRSRRCWSR